MTESAAWFFGPSHNAQNVFGVCFWLISRINSELVFPTKHFDIRYVISETTAPIFFLTSRL